MVLTNGSVINRDFLSGKVTLKGPAAISGIDIGVGGNGNVWITTTTNKVAQYNPITNDFIKYDGNGTQISVAPNGLPWIIGSNGIILEMFSSGNFGSHGGCGRDISIGTDGSVWIIGCEDTPQGGLVKRLVRATDTFITSAGIYGSRISALNEITAILLKADGTTHLIGIWFNKTIC